jgi:hypothetical protein
VNSSAIEVWRYTRRVDVHLCPLIVSTDAHNRRGKVGTLTQYRPLRTGQPEELVSNRHPCQQ